MAGATLRELSERTGISRDTIFIALKEAGLPLRSHTEVVAKRREHVDRRLRAKIINTFRRTGSIAATAQSTGASKERVRRILAEAGVDLEAYRVWRPSRDQLPTQLPTDEARRVLRRAARNTGGRLTRKQYRELAKTRTSSGRTWPAPDTLAKALGVFTWNEALTIAGLPTGLSSGVRSRPRDKELALIRRLAKRLGRAPTMPEYDASRGVGLVTAQALTKRTAGWTDVLKAAGLGPPK
jgi:lambda repressor-like predicted transcriptional regulator